MIAIVIPFYKFTFFQETLESLANQTNKNFNVYIGDDASKENCSDLLEQYKDRFNFVYKRFEHNLGNTSLVKQWERCIDLTTNEDWLMVLGDDDVLSTNYIAEFYKHLPEINKNNCNVVRFASVTIDNRSNQTSPLFTHPKIEKATDFFHRRFTNKTRSSLSEYMFKKHAYNKYGFYNYNLAWFTDDRAWLEFSEFKNIYSINSAFLSFRLSEENISRANFKTHEKEILRLAFFKFITLEHLSKFTRAQQRFLLLYYEQIIYKHKKVSFNFWLFVFTSFLKQCYFVQSIKFTRRVFIHLRKNDH
ncbi:glycosyltransferase family 2 protein [Mariniflexile maritimum]|uniref:glycosyltransferase family 2 protein n=1 Tax=Mariniflexile maritimum TaxID=2682493 RepID=UPI0012F66029|nr:glycosyltransferase family 2 protein [Mariniflexile maritimum]